MRDHDRLEKKANKCAREEVSIFRIGEKAKGQKNRTQTREFSRITREPDTHWKMLWKEIIYQKYPPIRWKWKKPVALRKLTWKSVLSGCQAKCSKVEMDGAKSEKAKSEKGRACKQVSDMLGRKVTRIRKAEVKVSPGAPCVQQGELLGEDARVAGIAYDRDQCTSRARWAARGGGGGLCETAPLPPRPLPQGFLAARLLRPPCRTRLPIRCRCSRYGIPWRVQWGAH